MLRLLCLVLIVACGPTAAEIKTAREATYPASPDDVYKLAEEETAKSYPIAERMPDERVFATQPMWFSDHGRHSDDPDDVQRKAGNMQVSFVVLVTAEGAGAKLLVTPKTVDYVPGKDKPSELAADDPKLPKWIRGRADKLQVAIHKRVTKAGASPPRAGSASAGQ